MLVRVSAIVVVMEMQQSPWFQDFWESQFLGCTLTCKMSTVWKNAFSPSKMITNNFMWGLCVRTDAMNRWCAVFHHVFHLFCEGVPVPVGVMHAFVRMFLSAAPPGAPLTFHRRLSEDRPSRLASSVCHCHQPEGKMKDRVLTGFPTIESCLLRLTYFFNLSFPSFIWNRYIA